MRFFRLPSPPPTDSPAAVIQRYRPSVAFSLRSQFERFFLHDSFLDFLDVKANMPVHFAAFFCMQLSGFL